MPRLFAAVPSEKQGTAPSAVVSHAGRRRTGILHQTGPLGMLEGALRFAVVIETELH